MGFGFLSWVIVTSAAVLFVTAGGISLCKRLNAPKWVNMVVPAGLCAAVIAVLIPLLIFGMDREMNGELPPAENLPLTLSQLTGETDTERFILEESSSFLASYVRCWDTGAEDVRLYYTIIDVKCPLFYNMLLNEQEQILLNAVAFVADGTMIPVLAERFDAEYARHAPDTLGDRWLICWDSRIVYLKTSWELTEEQLTTIANTLKP